MESPDKINDTRLPEYAKIPTLGEALNQARVINAISDPEVRAQSLVILNHLIEPSLGSLGFVDADFVYDTTPFGYVKSADTNPSVPFRGILEGFFDIDNIDGDSKDTDSQTTCLKISYGTQTITNRFTTFSYDMNLLFPVTEVNSISSMEELRISYGKPFIETLSIERKEILFQALQTHINSVRKSLKSTFIFDPRQTDGIEPWDYRDDNLHDLYDLRCLQIIANTEYGILQHDKEMADSVHLEVLDFTFSGFFLGVTGLQGINIPKKPKKNGHYKPHFAFEVFSTSDEAIASSLKERVSPILFVPISDFVELEITRVRPEE